MVTARSLVMRTVLLVVACIQLILSFRLAAHYSTTTAAVEGEQYFGPPQRDGATTAPEKNVVVVDTASRGTIRQNQPREEGFGEEELQDRQDRGLKSSNIVPAAAPKSKDIKTKSVVAKKVTAPKKSSREEISRQAVLNAIEKMKREKNNSKYLSSNAKSTLQVFVITAPTKKEYREKIARTSHQR